jgi:hypothetical protein
MVVGLAMKNTRVINLLILKRELLEKQNREMPAQSATSPD